MDKQAQIQQDFNTVWQHCVVEQNPPSWGRSIGRGDGCLYNGPDGSMCFYSVLLTDDERARVVENDTAYQIIRELPVERHQGCMDFYTRLQKSHDDNASLPKFHDVAEARLRELAYEYDLAIPETS